MKKTLNLKIQNDIREFNKKKEQELKKFEKYKEDETKKLIKERKQIISEQRQLNELKNKYQSNNNINKKDREEIEMLKMQFNKFQEDSKKKENNNRIIIERYKSQIDEANNKILELNGILNKLQPKQNNKKNNRKSKDNVYVPKKINNNVINEEPNLNFNYNNYTKNKNSNIQNELQEEQGEGEGEVEEENEEETYDLIFPEKYHNVEYNLLKSETMNDGKVIKYYDQNK